MFSAPDPPPPPKPPKPIPPPLQPPLPSELTKGNKNTPKGIMATILTGPQGDLTPARTTKKSLLGGGTV